MTSIAGGLTLTGIASFLAIGNSAMAQAPCTYPVAADWCKNVTSHSGSCTQPGSSGVCGASINATISDAKTFLSQNPTQRALVIVGTGGRQTYDLTHDTTLNSTAHTTYASPDNGPFTFSNVSPTSDDYDDVSCDNATLSAYSTFAARGCLIISGYGTTSASTTIAVSAAVPDIYLVGVSHVAFENLTFVQQTENAMSGTLVSVGTTSVNGTAGYATMTLDVNSSLTSESTQAPASFASVYSATSTNGTPYADQDVLVLQTGSSCSVSPTIVLTVSSTTTLSPGQSVFSSNATTITSNGTTTYSNYSIGDVVSYGVCNSAFAPNLGGPVATSGGHGSGLTVIVAPHPGPLAAYNRMVNSFKPGAYVRAYTLGSAPSLVQSLTGTNCSNSTSIGTYCTNSQKTIMATAINPGSGWVAVPPAQSASNANQWTITMAQPGSVTSPATYLPLYVSAHGGTTGPFTSLACIKTDGSQAIYINDTAAATGEDVVFKNVAFIDHSRATFRGILGGRAASLGAQPTYAEKLTSPTSYINYGVQLINYQINQSSSADCLQSDSGGVQIYGVNGVNNTFGPTWGNLLVNYSAYATGDDSLALFNDVGGQTVTYTQAGSSSTANYPKTIITYDSSIIPQGQSNSSTIANGFVRFIGSFTTNSDINTNILSTLGTNTLLSNSGSWSVWSADISNTVLTSEVGCDPLIFDGGAVPGNGCPVWATVDKSASQTATISNPPTLPYVP